MLHCGSILYFESEPILYAKSAKLFTQVFTFALLPLSLSFLLLFRFRVNIVIFGLGNENASRFLKGWNESTLKTAMNHFADVELTIQVCYVAR